MVAAEAAHAALSAKRSTTVAVSHSHESDQPRATDTGTGAAERGAQAAARLEAESMRRADPLAAAEAMEGPETAAAAAAAAGISPGSQGVGQSGGGELEPRTAGDAGDRIVDEEMKRVYERGMRESWVWEEMRRVRNIRPVSRGCSDTEGSVEAGLEQTVSPGSSSFCFYYC